MRVLLSVEHTGDRLTLLRSTASAGSSSLVYAHDKDDETVLLLRGGAIYWVGDRRYRMVCHEVSEPWPQGRRLSFDAMVRAAGATGHSILALPAEVDRRAVPDRGRRAGSGRGQSHAEAEPLRRVLGVHVAAVGLDDAAHDGQSESRTG